METDKKIQVSVVMGSQSDWQTMHVACDLLEKFNVSFEKTSAIIRRLDMDSAVEIGRNTISSVEPIIIPNFLKYTE